MGALGDIGLLVTLGIGIAIVVLVLSRMNEIFCVSVRDGRVLVVRGALPPSLLTTIADVCRRDGVRRGTVRALKQTTHARLVTSGMGDGTTQRLRNVFGHHSIQKLRSARVLPGAPRNLGQWLGIAWLAWLLVGRRD